jgi:PAS domain S-box-containing protein
MRRFSFRDWPFSYYLILAIFAILAIAVVCLIGISFHATEQTLRDSARAVQLQTEESLVTVFRTKEEGVRIFDDSLNSRMEGSFPLFLAEYERSGRNPYAMDLESVQRALGEGMDLYVIDGDATIIATTYDDDLGLRFRDYAPYFADYLDRIRVSDGMHPDRAVSAKTTGEMKKYAYYPTADHRYILELGLTVKSVPIASFGYLDHDLIGQVEHANPYLVDARVFETTLRERINDTSVDISDPALKALLGGVLSNRTSLTLRDEARGITTRYLFVELGNDNYGSDLSRIIELTYTDQPIKEALASSIRYHLFLGLVALLACTLLTSVSIRNLIRPTRKMIEDVNTIASGDLDHPITSPFGKEMIGLEESISAMVSRLKNTITELRTSEEKYRALVESANSVIIRSAPDGTIRFINEYAQEFFGYTAPEIIGKDLVGTIVPAIESTGKDLEAKIRDLVAHPENYAVSENENIRKDGSRVWIAWANRPLRDDQGNLTEILSIGNDITRLKQVEQELRESEENYRTLVQGANSIILRFNSHGKVTFINEYAQEFFGYTASEIIGKDLVGTIVPAIESTGKDLEAKIRDLVAHPENYAASENENIRKDGSRVWIAWTNRPLRDDQGNLTEILSIGNDITRLKQVENEIQALNSELEQRVSERTRQLVDVNRNLESFTYSVSHDLRAPLRAISGYSTILLEELQDISEKDRRYLELVRQNAHDMGRLIDDLLNFSRLGRQSLQKQILDPGAVVRDLVRELSSDPNNKAVMFRIGSLPHARPTRSSSGRPSQTSFPMLLSFPGAANTRWWRLDRSWTRDGRFISFRTTGLVLTCNSPIRSLESSRGCTMKRCMRALVSALP